MMWVKRFQSAPLESLTVQMFIESDRLYDGGHLANTSCIFIHLKESCVRV